MGFVVNNSVVQIAPVVRVGLIGAGKFGSMFLAQAPTSRGIQVTAIADLDLDRARDACVNVGWSAEQVGRVHFTEDAVALVKRSDVDVVVEATGHPAAGIRHARAAIAAGKHVIMVNVEADVLAGPLLAKQALEAGVVYSLAYGDQPALICELVDWARNCGFEVLAAGKGTRYLPYFHESTPDTVWEYRGVKVEDAKVGGMNAQMFNSFIDGTKAAIEMAAVANATRLTPAPDGLAFVPVAADKLAQKLNAKTLHHRGQVEVVSSVERDGSPIPGDLRWGVYVVFDAPNAYTRRCFSEYGVPTDESGNTAALYRPVHLIGLELNISIFSAAHQGLPTGSPKGFVADVVATAKRDIEPGEILDGEGGFLVWGKLMPASDSLRRRGLPIGLASQLRIKRKVAKGAMLSWDDVEINGDDEIYRFRREMEQAFSTDTLP